MATRIQLRRDTSANWQSTNPVLALGEPGAELDTNNMKIGDGVKTWNELSYTAQTNGSVPVFISVDDYYSQQPRISTDGINWTAQVDTGSPGTTHSSEWSVNGVVIGNGVIVYRGYNEKSDKDELRYSDNPYQAAILPDSDITRVGPNGEEINWDTLTFGGGYFVAGGWYYDSDRNDYNYPIAAYSANGATWTMIDIDLNFVRDIVVTQRNANSNNVGGMRISSITRGTNGWLFTLNYEIDNTDWQTDNDRLNPGAFYITSITTDLNNGSYFATMPATDWSAWFDGHGWLAYYSTKIIYKNTSSDPRQGTWTDIDWENITSTIDFVSSHVGSDAGPGDYYGIGEIAAGEIDGVNYMAISDYYGVVYYTDDQGSTWNYVTPGPAYAGIYDLDINVNGGIRFTNSGSGIDWGQSPKIDWSGEKITISGSYVVELNGTWWIDSYDSGAGNWPLYSDRAKQNRLDTSSFDPLDIITKNVAYGNKGDNSIILPNTNNIVVGQRIFGEDAVRAKEDVDGNWAEPNLVTSVNTDTNRITLKYPLYQNWGSGNENPDRNGPQTLSFQAVVKYTHGDNIDELIYGGGKFVAIGGNTNRAYFTTNMTDWHFTVNADDQGGFNGSRQMAYGLLDIDTNSLRNKSATVTGITNSLTIGDTFNVNVVAITDAPVGPYDYYGATEYNEGGIHIDPSNGLWYLGTYDQSRSAQVAIYSYTGWQNEWGNNEEFGDYYHATGVKIETADNEFYFDDYYGTFIADKIAIGNTLGSSNNDYYGYSHIEDVHFDGASIYTSDGYELTIYNYFAPSPTGGGVHIHWDDDAHVRVNSNGVTLTDGTYDWQFTNDRDGVLYAPASSEIDITGYWTIGEGNGTSGYPYIGAVNNLNVPQSDAYDFVIQAGQSYDGPTVNNYWYFNRNGTLQLPVGGDIVNSAGQSVLNQDIPQNAVSADGDYTLVIGDRGKHIYKTGTGDIKIPTNASVAFPIGTCITLVTGSDNSTRISPVTPLTTTVILSNFGSNANINVPADTYVTILKIATDKWMIQT